GVSGPGSGVVDGRPARIVFGWSLGPGASFPGGEGIDCVFSLLEAAPPLKTLWLFVAKLVAGNFCLR
ncbi:MAG TPA: hypothetical protein PLT76_07760, partial [Candidatus Omnitrophota bacterium]|nr:hypothetical protein [Candidatus Omnitrophota bacterium]HQP13051.1 hypothetical protein [Candidatus Omnitrophota bacterium]